MTLRPTPASANNSTLRVWVLAQGRDEWSGLLPPDIFVREPHRALKVVRDAATMHALHRAAGFGDIELDHYEELSTRPDGTRWTRRYSIVIARP